MERFNALGRGAQLMLIGGVLLLIDLFLPWQDFGNDFSDAVGVDASFSGWRGFGGVLVGLLTIVLLAWVIVRAGVRRHSAPCVDGHDGRDNRDADPDLHDHQDAHDHRRRGDDLGLAWLGPRNRHRGRCVQDGAGSGRRRHAEERGERPELVGRLLNGCPRRRGRRTRLGPGSGSGQRRPPRCLQQRIPHTMQQRLRRARPRTWPRKQLTCLRTRRMRPRTQ